MLLITTRGRKSGQWQRTAIFYAPDGDDILVFASNRAGEKDPAWYLNLVEDPEVHVTLPGRTVRTSARVLSGGEREDAWQKLIEVFPPYVEHQEKVERTIGIVRLEPAA
jgi:deazaflavin-dependent oxidoreductase (nitroreductase family)